MFDVFVLIVVVRLWRVPAIVIVNVQCCAGRWLSSLPACCAIIVDYLCVGAPCCAVAVALIVLLLLNLNCWQPDDC